jgi:hypothetical protein
MSCSQVAQQAPEPFSRALRSRASRCGLVFFGRSLVANTRCRRRSSQTPASMPARCSCPHLARRPCSFPSAMPVCRADTPASDGLLAATLQALGDDGCRSEVDAAISAARRGLIALFPNSERLAARRAAPPRFRVTTGILAPAEAIALFKLCGGLLLSLCRRIDLAKDADVPFGLPRGRRVERRPTRTDLRSAESRQTGQRALGFGVSGPGVGVVD